MARSSTRLPPPQVEKVFGDLRTALTVAESIRKDVGEVSERLCERELRAELQVVKAGIKLHYDHTHTLKARRFPEGFQGAAASSVADPLRIPMHTEAYEAYIRDGFTSLASVRKMSSEQTSLV